MVLGMMVAGAGLYLFYYFAETKSGPQWIGVAESQEPATDKSATTVTVAKVDRTEPAPPSAGNDDVDLATKENDSAISGEMTIASGFAESNVADRPARAVQTEVEIDADVLDAIGQTLWTMIQPISDPLLASFETRTDAFSQMLLGKQPELKLPDPTPKQERKSISDRLVSVQPASSTRARSEEKSEEDVTAKMQTVRSGSTWSDGNLPPGAVQSIPSRQLELTGSTLPGSNPFVKERISTIPIGR